MRRNPASNRKVASDLEDTAIANLRHEITALIDRALGEGAEDDLSQDHPLVLRARRECRALIEALREARRTTF